MLHYNYYDLNAIINTCSCKLSKEAIPSMDIFYAMSMPIFNHLSITYIGQTIVYYIQFSEL